MEEDVINSDDIVQIARLALAGRPQDVQTYIRRLARRYRSVFPAVASQLDLVFTGAIADSQRNFDAAMSGSTGDLDGLLVAIAVLAVLSATLVFVGFRPRISEYR